ncbi:hypothetical protein RclHR1_05550001 [Rhizophagus clarus]|uniref:Uncharacterized protein n=1 Tax=Rhizophagus clarus TaxID=94130 RepID=A0A2Z6RNV6_9GLOM|nr:hypothetical protein RclHR1_05550001 [Rhizophagus clarus]
MTSNTNRQTQKDAMADQPGDKGICYGFITFPINQEIMGVFANKTAKQTLFVRERYLEKEKKQVKEKKHLNLSRAMTSNTNRQTQRDAMADQPGDKGICYGFITFPINQEIMGVFANKTAKQTLFVRERYLEKEKKQVKEKKHLNLSRAMTSNTNRQTQRDAMADQPGDKGICYGFITFPINQGRLRSHVV